MKQKILAFAVLSAGVIILLWLTASLAYAPWDFRNNLWGPVNQLIQHKPPYSYDAPYGPYPAVWMPSILGPFFFLGYLPLGLAARGWLLLTFGGFIGVIGWIAGRFPLPLWKFTLGVWVIFSFPPLWGHIQLGQFSLIFTTLLLIGVFLPDSEKILPLLLALGATKPQLTILVYPGLLIHTWRAKGFRAALRLALLTAVYAACLTLPLFFYYPDWFAGFWRLTLNNLQAGWNLPTLFVQLPILLGGFGRPLWALVTLLVLALTAWLWLKRPPRQALPATLALTLLVTPYAFSWDFVLLLPAFILLLLHLRKKPALIVLISGMLASAALQVIPRLQQEMPESSVWWVPPATILLFLFALALEHGVSRRSRI